MACGPGGSQPKPATPAVIFVVGDALIAMMEKWFGSAKWIPLVSYLAGQTFTAQSLCDIDPPPMPTFVFPDDFLLTPLPPFLSASGAQKLAQIVEIAAWQTFCDCISIPTPPPPVDTGYPPGAVIINPPGIPPGTTGNCWHQVATLSNATATLPGSFNNVSLIFLPVTTTVTVNSGNSVTPSTPAQVIPNGAIDITHSITWSGVAAGDVLSVNLFPCNAAGSPVGNHIILDQATGSGSSGPVTYTFPTTTHSWFLSYSATNAQGQPVGGFNITIDVSVDCTSSNQPAVPCCPPDQSLYGIVNQILVDVQQLLDRGALPRLPLYQSATTHTGLSGSGSVVIQTNAVAFRVDVTSDLTHWPNNPGDPNYYFSMGFITSFAISTPIKGWRLVYSGQTFPLAAQCDEVGFTLPPGIAVNITELVEQPGA